jgi:endonuclease YncB( thermonuclease family)
MAFLLGLGLLLGATPVAPQTGRTVAPFRPPSAEVLRQLRAILQKSEPDAEGYYPPEIHGWVRRGKARVIDGDTIRIGAMRIGLAGIDAPALRQTCRTAAGAPWGCGTAARARLEELIDGAAVVCFGVRDRPDGDGRMLAVCKVVPQPDLNGKMVGAGYALAHGRTSEHYQPRQRAARGRRAGLWAGHFEVPWLWRRKHRRAP